jgi:hypothetical protein
MTVVAGTPTDEELAAVLAVLGAVQAQAAAATAARPASRRSAWSARSRLLRSPVAAGPGAWRASALPR